MKMSSASIGIYAHLFFLTKYRYIFVYLIWAIFEADTGQFFLYLFSVFPLLRTHNLMIVDDAYHLVQLTFYADKLLYIIIIFAKHCLSLLIVSCIYVSAILLNLLQLVFSMHKLKWLPKFRKMSFILTSLFTTLITFILWM
jgi:hypothetical protein